MRRLLSILTVTIGLVFVSGCFNRPTDPATVKGGAFDRMKDAQKGKTETKAKGKENSKGVPDM